MTRKGVERKEIRRGRSQYVLDRIHDVVGNKHLECKNAESLCLKALLEQYFPSAASEENVKTVIDSLHVLIPALYTKLGVQAGWFSTFNKLLQKKFPQPNLVAYSKNKLRLPKEARILQQINYNVQVAKANASQKELTDTKVLEVINSLRRAAIISLKCVLLGCVWGPEFLKFVSSLLTKKLKILDTSK